MAFDKVILGAITKTVKSTARFDIAINSIKTQFNNGCPAPQEITKIIQSKNQINQALTQALGALNIINSAAGTINGILIGIDVAITAIKALPIPSAITPLAPAGIGPSLIPGKIFPALSDSLIALRDFIKTNKGLVNQVPSAISTIQSSIQKTINLLNSLDALILKCLNEQTSNLTPSEKEAYFTQIGFALAQTGNNSNSTVNISVNSILEAQLQSNAINPLFYRDFKLTLEYNNLNKFSFPLRRIKGVNDKTGQIIYNYGGKYSYSSSTEVLFDEIKYQIDVLNKTGDLEGITGEADDSVKEAAKIQLKSQIQQAELARKKAIEAANELNIATSYINEANKSASEVTKSLEQAKTAVTIVNAKEAAKETKTAADKATNEVNKILSYVPLIEETTKKSEAAASEAEVLSSINPSSESTLAVEDAKKSADKVNKILDEINKLSSKVNELLPQIKDIAEKAESTRIKYLEPFGYEGEYDKRLNSVMINDQEAQWYYFNSRLSKWIEIPPSNLLPFKFPGIEKYSKSAFIGYRLYSYLEYVNPTKTDEWVERYEIMDIYTWDNETLKWTLFKGNEKYTDTRRNGSRIIDASGRSAKLSDDWKKGLKFNGFTDYFTNFAIIP